VFGREIILQEKLTIGVGLSNTGTHFAILEADCREREGG
jgi:hypothetical protein